MKGPSPHPELPNVLTCNGCDYIVTCDGHYNYCRALPDTAPALRPGCERICIGEETPLIQKVKLFAQLC
jgi:hypothetical protein